MGVEAEINQKVDEAPRCPFDSTILASTMSDEIQGRRPSRRHRIVTLVTTLVVAFALVIGACAMWQWFPPGRDLGLFDMLPIVPEATDEMSRAIADGKAVAAQFVDHLRAERWHDAYQLTSRTLRRRMDQAALETLVKDSPPLEGPPTRVSFNFLMTPGDSLSTSDRAGSVPAGGAWVLLVNENGAIKVDRFVLGKRTAP